MRGTLWVRQCSMLAVQLFPSTRCMSYKVVQWCVTCHGKVSLSLDIHPIIYPQIKFTRKKEWEECDNIIGSFSNFLTYVHENTSLHIHCTFKTSYKWRTRPFTKGVDKKILFYSVNLNVYLILILTYVITVIWLSL